MTSERERDWIARVIDANANRAREGLRVVEEITRLVLNNAHLTDTLKKNRHAIEDLVSQLTLSKGTLLSARDSEDDIGFEGIFDESSRKNCEDIFWANIRRSQESCRVLEEFSKLFNDHIPVSFKKIRFSLYTLEKEIHAELRKHWNETC